MSNLTITLRIFLIVGIVEVLIMLGLEDVHKTMPLASLAAVDAALLTLFATPLVYFLVIRPYIEARDQAEEELQEARHELERRVEEQKRAEHELRKLTHAVEYSPAAVVITDPKGRIEYVNPKFTDHTGYRPDEVIGHNPNILKSGHTHAEEYERLWEDITHDREWRGEFLNKRKDGSLYWDATSISPVKSADGTITAFIAVKEDITERKRIEEELEHQKSLFEAIFNSISDAVVFTNPDRQMVTINPGLRKVFGYELDELAGLTTVVLYESQEEYDRQGRIRFNLSAKEKIAPYVVNYRRKNGQVFPGETLGTMVKDKTGKVMGFIGVIRDISERKKADEALHQARKAADNANRAKSNFISSMSHEFRTPLNAILGFGQLLIHNPRASLDAQQEEYVGHILKGGDHLLELVNEVLDLSTIEAGKVNLAPEAMETGKVIEECLFATRALAERRGIQIADRTQGKDLPAVWADHMRFKQVLLNLLSNAVKYNRDGGTVDFDCWPTADGMVHFDVADTGKGIPESRRGEIFQPFSRLGAEATEVEGSGVGLAISKKLVELMGGRIGFESAEDQGSTFWIELPLAEGKGAVQGNTKGPVLSPFTASPQDSLGKRTVLYVEDDPENRRLVEAIISHLPGMVLHCASTAEEGLDIARKVKPDVILMDINLPGMDGFEALEHLRGEDETHAIPVIAVTARAMSGDLEKGLAAGFKAYLTKPIQVYEMVSALQEVLADSP